jgi:uncharacterized integral membrane protein
MSDKTSGYLAFKWVWNGWVAWIGIFGSLIVGALMMGLLRMDWKKLA